MIVNCKNITKLPYANSLKLVAGIKGKNRIIRWVHYLEEPKYIDWLKGGELVILTGLVFKNNVKQLLVFIEALYDKDIAGVVINLSDYIDYIPQEVIALGNFLGFPIFEMPAEVRIVDVSQSICKAIFENRNRPDEVNKFFLNLIDDKSFVNEKKIKKAMQYGYNPQLEYYSVIIRKAESKDYNKKTIDNMADYFGEIARILVEYMDNINVIQCWTENYSCFMIPIDNSSDIVKILNTIFKDIKREKNFNSLIAGISQKWRNLNDLKKSIDNAYFAISTVKRNIKKSQIIQYEQLGIVKLFREIENKSVLEDLTNQFLGRLIETDKNNQMDLLKTIEKYIECDCNANAAANALYIHINTLRYRLKKVESILNCSMNNMEMLFRLQLALKIKKYLE